MKLLTLARDLQRRKARERQGLFVAEGARAVEELLRSPLRVVGALTTPAAVNAARASATLSSLTERGIPVEEVDERDFRSASDTDSPQGVLAIAEVPERSLDRIVVNERTRILVLDGIQDPGNVGTILRTAAALGTQATIALPGTVDLWNAKVVRSAMGALFQHDAIHSTWEALDAFLARYDVALWGADGAGSPLGDRAAPARLALAVGNEGAGLSDAARGRVTHRVAVPIVPDVESLNVAVAAGILLFHFRQ